MSSPEFGVRSFMFAAAPKERSSQDNGWSSCKGFQKLHKRIYCSPRNVTSLNFLVDSKTQPRTLHVSRVLFSKMLLALSSTLAIRGCELRKHYGNELMSVPSNQKSSGRRNVGGSTVKVVRLYLSTPTAKGSTSSPMTHFLRKLNSRLRMSRAFSCSKVHP
jgi:hypothetical protein